MRSSGRASPIAISGSTLRIACRTSVSRAAGILGAIAVGGFVASLLFDVQLRDPIVIAAVTAIVGVVALLASVVAARQGLVIDPAGALREE